MRLVPVPPFFLALRSLQAPCEGFGGEDPALKPLSIAARGLLHLRGVPQTFRTHLCSPHGRAASANEH